MKNGRKHPIGIDPGEPESCSAVAGSRCRVPGRAECNVCGRFSPEDAAEAVKAAIPSGEHS